MITSAKESEQDFDRFFGTLDRSSWDGCVSFERSAVTKVLTVWKIPRRGEALSNRHKLAGRARERKITDPSKAILSAIPRYESAGEHFEIQKIFDEAESNDASVPKQEWDQGDEGTTRISIVEVMNNARRDRRRELDRLPAVYLDD